MYAKSPKKSKNLLTNSKECRIINKLTHREQEKTKKRRVKLRKKGLSEPEGFQRIPKNPRKKTKSFLKNLLTKQTKYDIIFKLS